MKTCLNRSTWALLTAASLLIMLGCSENDPVETVSTPAPQTTARFDITTGNPADIPIPNDLLRNPLTGQLALPNPTNNPLYAAVNTLYGFSTSAPIVVPFDGPVEPSSVNQDTLFVFNLTTNQAQPMSYQVLTNPETNNSTVILTPAKPLSPGTPHIVIVSPGVMGAADGRSVAAPGLVSLLKGGALVDENGNSTNSALDDATAQALEPVRQLYQPIWSNAERLLGLSRYQYAVAFQFTTQPLFSTLPALRAQIQELTPQPTTLQAFPSPAAIEAFLALTGQSAIPHDALGALYYGSFEAPNFLQQHPAGIGPIGPFVYEGGELVQLGTSQITFWASVPASAQGPVPVMIFQHGLGRSKEDMLAIANTAASQGIGMIGIDIVLHGDRSSDFFNNETGAPGPDGVADASGTGFINLLSPLQTRDNGRQTVSDLFTLTRMITSAATDLNSDGVPEFAPQGLTFIGQSLGGLFGSVFAGLEPNISLACLNVPGGRVGSLLPSSPAISSSINPALEQAAGLVPGTVDYMLFWLIFQTCVDDADPFNYAAHFTSGGLSGGVGTTVLVQEMQGDLVVPNSATEDLVRAMGIPQVDATWLYDGQDQVQSPYVGSGHFQYTGGRHGFLLDPNQGPTVAGQTQAMYFLLNGLQGSPTIIDPFAAGKTKPLPGPVEVGDFQQTFNFDHIIRVTP